MLHNKHFTKLFFRNYFFLILLIVFSDVSNRCLPSAPTCICKNITSGYYLDTIMFTCVIYSYKTTLSFNAHLTAEKHPDFYIPPQSLFGPPASIYCHHSAHPSPGSSAFLVKVVGAEGQRCQQTSAVSAALSTEQMNGLHASSLEQEE